jgi:hypothetical protein
VTDVKSDIVAIDFHSLGPAIVEYGQDVWPLHKSITRFDAPEFVGNARNLNPLARFCARRRCDDELEYEDGPVQGTVFPNVPNQNGWRFTIGAG